MIGWSSSWEKRMRRSNASISQTRGWLTRVEFRLDVAARDEPLGHPVDHAVVLGMGADEGAVLAGHHHHVQHLLVEQAHAIVGHEDLDRAVAGFDQPRQVLLQRLGGRIGDPEMEGVVRHRAGGSEARVVVHDVMRAGRPDAGPQKR